MASSKSESHPKAINNIGEFHDWVSGLEGDQLLYRGLANARWEVEASAVRRLKQFRCDPSESVPAKVFNDYIEDLLEQARGRGFGIQDGTKLSDLELLADLQHYGAATCLIDFTTNPLVALWFACNKVSQDEDSKNWRGKVVAICTDDLDNFEEITYKKMQGSGTILDFLHKGKLYQWRPSDRNSRVISQQSVFILGKAMIEKSEYKEIQIDTRGSEDEK